MAFGYVFVVFLYVQYYVVVSTPVERLCPLGQFLDEITGSCTSCQVICGQSEEKDTGNICEHFCPGFKAEREAGELCPPETYLDTTLRCELCSDICDREIKDDRCESKCPDYVKKSSERVTLHLILWIIVIVLSIVLLVFVTAIVVKTVSIKRQARSRRTNYRKDAPFIVPYLKLDEEKPDQRVNQWLKLLHSPAVEANSSFGSKSSSIYTPPKTII